MQWRNKQQIMRYAKNKCNLRPVSTTPEGRMLSTFLGQNPDFRDELKAVRPDWFQTTPTLAVGDIVLPEVTESTVLESFSKSTRAQPYRQAYRNKVAFLKQALAGKPYPTGRQIATYLKQDPAFKRLIELINPEWLTPSRERKSTKEYGPKVEGARPLRKARNHSNSKLTDQDYKDILEAYLEEGGVRGFVSNTARKYGVTPSRITKIIKRAFPD